jgi:hypothetical protein
MCSGMVGLGLVLAATRPALAQSPEDIAAARALGIDGVKMAEAGDCNGAIAKLQAAEKLFHAPTTADRLGECQIAVGHVVAGTETLQRVVHEPLAPNAPAAFTAAQQRAQTALNAALPKIAQLKIHVEGAPADKVTVVVDDEKVASALLDGNRPTDPGTHQVKASAPGFLDATDSVQLAPGGSGAVSLTLKPDPNAAAAAPPPVVAPPPQGQPATPAPPAETASHGSSIAPILFYAAGGAGVIVGSVFGIMALKNKSSLDSACTNKVCPGSSQSDINSLNTNATISSIGFGVGIVGAALGTYFLLTSGGEEESGAVVPHRQVGSSVQPWIGLGSAGISGSFR